ncbi:MAG TPA: Flp pilus assembly protein CpaB [Armatimonadota bacterium]|nr:Flp pilus assembly protein CpaB [Armatimonadota bacterium]
MAQTPRRRVIALAIILGIATSAFIVMWLKKQAHLAQVPVEAVAATSEIASGAVINAGMVTIRTFPREMVPPGALAGTESVIGMVALEQIKAGSAISQKQIGPARRLAYRVPPLMRAVTVALDPIIGVGGFIRPGDHVDVIATFNVGQGTVTKTVLQDVELLATGREVVAVEIEPETGKQGKPIEIPNATLAVTPADAEKLVLADSRGKLRLALRGAEDASFISTRGVTSRQVMGIVPPDVPEKGSAAPRVASAAPAASGPGIPWKIEPLPGGAVAPEAGKKVQIVRGTKLEETIVPE